MINHSNFLLKPRQNLMKKSQEGPHLEGRLRAQTRGIIVEFNILKCKLFDMLERHSVPKLAEYLEDYHAENLTSFDDVKKFIRQKSSFYDYEIVNHIIGVAGTEGDKERLHQYEKQFEAYAKHQFRTPSTSPTTSVSQISFKLDSEYSELQDDHDKRMQFQCRLCNLLKLPIRVSQSAWNGLRLTRTLSIFLSKITFPLCKKD